MAASGDSIDDYINTFPEDVQSVLQQMRSVLTDAVPNSTEAISYGVPTLRVNGKNVVHFAGWKHHVSTYPVPAVNATLEKKISRYRGGKGTLKFPLSEPIPYDLIGEIGSLLLAQRFNV